MALSLRAYDPKLRQRAEIVAPVGGLRMDDSRQRKEGQELLGHAVGADIERSQAASKAYADKLFADRESSLQSLINSVPKLNISGVGESGGVPYGQTQAGGMTGVPYAKEINKAAGKYGVPAGLLAGMAKQESDFNTNMKYWDNGAWSYGLTSIRDYGNDHKEFWTDPRWGGRTYDPETNLDYLAWWLTDQAMGRYGAKNWEQAARMWNGGPSGPRKSATKTYWDKVVGHGYGGF